jgi:hypothetical protein
VSGPWGRTGRAIPVSQVIECSTATLGWAGVFGLGLPLHRKTTRFTVRPGPVLCLTLRDGEHIRVTTEDPGAACGALSAP